MLKELFGPPQEAIDQAKRLNLSVDIPVFDLHAEQLFTKLGWHPYYCMSSIEVIELQNIFPEKRIVGIFALGFVHVDFKSDQSGDDSSS